MSEPPILQRLQDGEIDFDTAFSKIAARAKDSEESAHASGEPGVHVPAAVVRTAEGKVLLQSVDEAFVGAPAPLSPPKVMLAPVERPPGEERKGTTLTPAPEESSRQTPQRAVPEPAPGSEPRAVTSPALTNTPKDEEVVEVTTAVPGVALITMRDEKGRNMFSEALIRGIKEAMQAAAKREDVNVAVVQGHGNWFCSGGTPEMLEAIRRGEASFQDDDFFRALLDCPLPTVAAMQGHALGGGCTFGLYADLIVMSESAYYAANFLDHGFTPGVGATFIFPYKLGNLLGTEMLMTASRYQGRELKARGASVTVLPREQVLPHALEIAGKLASKPRQQVLRLKMHLAEPVRAALPDVLCKEQAMHDEIFAGHRGEGAARKR